MLSADMHPNFSYVIDKIGPPQNPSPMDPAVMAKLTGHVPSGLIDLWSDYGIGSWGGGKFQLCNPEEYNGLINILFGGDSEFSRDRTHLIAYGAFGDLLVWNEDKEVIKIELPYLYGAAMCHRANWKPKDVNIPLISPLLDIKGTRSYTLFEGDAGTPMFSPCVKAHGPLAPGECYGLFPALALGGTAKTDHVKRVKALEHFTFLAQLGPIRLVNYQPTGMRVIRELGT